jgi:hypothetical protein
MANTTIKSIVSKLNVPGEWEEDEGRQYFSAYCNSAEQYAELKDAVTKAGIEIDYDEPESNYIELVED